MKERGLVVVLAFLLAIGATAAVFLYVNGVKSNATSGGTTTQMIVSKQIIPAGTDLDTLVNSGAFVTKTIPTDDLVSGAVTSIQQLQNKTTSQAILVGEQIPLARVNGSVAGPAPTGIMPRSSPPPIRSMRITSAPSSSRANRWTRAFTCSAAAPRKTRTGS